MTKPKARGVRATSTTLARLAIADADPAQQAVADGQDNDEQSRTSVLLQRMFELSRPADRSVEAQCRAVVARLEEVNGVEELVTARTAASNAAAIAALPDPGQWSGAAHLPWGYPGGGGQLSSGIKPVRAGRAGYYLQHGTSCSTRFATASAKCGTTGHWQCRGLGIDRCIAAAA